MAEGAEALSADEYQQRCLLYTGTKQRNPVPVSY